MRATTSLAVLLCSCAPVNLTIVPLETDPVVVEPEPDNLPPTADAGDDQRVPVGTPLQWSVGESADPDLDPLSMTWTVLQAPPDSRAVPRPRADERVAFDPDVVGEFVLELRVDDGRGGWATDQVVIESVDSWALGGGRPAPGSVYLMGRIADECDRGVSALGGSGGALVGMDCRAERESTFVQVTGKVWWFDGLLPREMTCDGPCVIDRPSRYPDSDVAQNDAALDTPCRVARDVLLGPGHLLARCQAQPDLWVGRDGEFRSSQWRPFALNAHNLALVRGVSGDTRDQIAVLNMTTGQVVVADPELDWQFLRSWRSFEDGFRIASYDSRGRTTLVEVGQDGRVGVVAGYADLSEGFTVLVGGRLDSAGNLYLPVNVDGRFQVVRADLQGGLQSVHDDWDDPLVRVAGGGELITGL